MTTVTDRGAAFAILGGAANEPRIALTFAPDLNQALARPFSAGEAGFSAAC